MLAEIFMVRLEAATRVPEEMAPSSNTRLYPSPTIRSLRSSKAAIGLLRLCGRSQFNSGSWDVAGYARSKERQCWFQLLRWRALTAQAQQPPKAGCRVDFQARIRHRQKGECDYEPGQQIVPDRTTLASPLLALSCLIGESNNGAVADSRSFHP